MGLFECLPESVWLTVELDALSVSCRRSSLFTVENRYCITTLALVTVLFLEHLFILSEMLWGFKLGMIYILYMLIKAPDFNLNSVHTLFYTVFKVSKSSCSILIK